MQKDESSDVQIIKLLYKQKKRDVPITNVQCATIIISMCIQNVQIK